MGEGSVSGLVLLVVGREGGREGGKEEGIIWVILRGRAAVGDRARSGARRRRRKGGSGGAAAAAATVASPRT